VRKPVKLTGPGVTAEDIAAIFRISKKRQAEIIEIVARHSNGRSADKGSAVKASKSASRKKRA